MGSGFFLVLLAMFVFMYFLLIRPQRPAAERHAEMLGGLKPGDEVITAGGIYGEVVRGRRRARVLEIDDDVRSPSPARDREHRAAGGAPAPRGREDEPTRPTMEPVMRERSRSPQRRRAPSRLADLRRYLLILAALFGAVGGVVVLALFKTPTLGLDLQGGLEVVLQAEAPAGARSRRRTSTGRSRSCGSASTSSASPSPRSASRATTRSPSSSPASTTPRRAAALVGQTAQLQFYDLQGDDASPRPRLRTAGSSPVSPHPPVAPEPAEARREGDADRLVPLLEQPKQAPGRPRRHEGGDPPPSSAGQAPKDSKFYAVPEGRTILTCGPSASALPGSEPGAADPNLLLPLQVRPEQRREADPGADRRGPQRRGHATGLRRRTTSPSSRSSSRTRAGTSSTRSRASSRSAAASRRTSRAPRAPSGKTAIQSFAIVLDGEIRSFPSIDFDDHPRRDRGRARADQRPRLDRRGEGPRARPPDRRPAVRVRPARARRTSPPRSAKTRSARRSSRASAASSPSRSSCSSSTASSASSRSSASASTASSSTAPILHLQRHADAPGLRRPRSSRSASRRTRTSSSSNASRKRCAPENPCAPPSRTGYSQGLQHDHRRERRDDDHRGRPLRWSATGERQGLRPDAPDRNALSMVTAVAATRALLGACWPASAGSTTRRSWARARRRSRPGSGSTSSGKAKIWFAISGVVILIGIGSLAYQGLNLGIDFEGGSQVTFKTAAGAQRPGRAR